MCRLLIDIHFLNYPIRSIFEPLKLCFLTLVFLFFHIHFTMYIIHTTHITPSCCILSTKLKYFVTFFYDFSHVIWLYLMKSRYELLFFSHFNVFCAEIQTQFHISIQTLRIDNAVEYFWDLFSPLCYNM